MKLKTSVTTQYGTKEKYLVKPITWLLNDIDINTPTEKLEKIFSRCIKSVEIPLDKIENSSEYIAQFNTDLYLGENIEPKLGGCNISGATIHASNVKSKEINLLFKKQLVRQILETINQLKNDINPLKPMSKANELYKDSEFKNG